MKKMLHDRLRDWADKGGEGHYPSTEMLYDTICGSNLGAEDEVKAFHMLADEIERYYIPRPTFEDGDPVVEGIDTEHGEVHCVTVRDDGSWELFGKFHMSLCKGLSNEHPKKFDNTDKYGVPIEVGDTVYTLLTKGEDPYGTCYTVVKVGSNTAYGVECKRHGILEKFDFNAKSLSHEKPFLLGDVISDMERYLREESPHSTSIAYWKNILVDIKESIE